MDRLAGSSDGDELPATAMMSLKEEEEEEITWKRTRKKVKETALVWTSGV